jgi:hypothetical protein
MCILRCSQPQASQVDAEPVDACPEVLPLIERETDRQTEQTESEWEREERAHEWRVSTYQPHSHSGQQATAYYIKLTRITRPPLIIASIRLCVYSTTHVLVACGAVRLLLASSAGFRAATRRSGS